MLMMVLQIHQIVIKKITNEIGSKLITLRANFGKSMASHFFLQLKGDYIVKY